MRFFLKPFMIISIFVILAGCAAQPSKVGEDEAKEAMEKLTYVRDKRTNLCFAMIASRRGFQAKQNGIGLTNVPCEKVLHLLTE